MNDECPWCGEDLILSGALDLDLDPQTGAEFLNFRGCCEMGAAMLEEHGTEAAVDILGGTYEDVCEEITGRRPSRVEAGQEVRRGRETDLADADGLLVHKLEIEVETGASQAEVFALIRQHHRHHEAPHGWHFGLIARRGGVVVGVAVAGRPVSRHLQARGWVEITRCCTFGDSRLRRDAASALYRAAVAEYRRRGCEWTTRSGKTTKLTTLCTYTLPSEGGASLRAAGFVDEGPAGGGSWDRSARKRADNAPTDVKTRWTIAL